jgi:DNA-binding transcriptional MocR family regulator
VRYEGEAPPSLHALEGGERVAFTSSFSKTVAPGLRVGYFVVPGELVAGYDDRAVSTTISPPLLPQAIVHELHVRGGFEPNLERVRALLRARRDAMLGALDRELGGHAPLLARAAEAGVTFVKGADFFPGGAGGRAAARLAFSYETPERIEEGVRILAGLVAA